MNFFMHIVYECLLWANAAHSEDCILVNLSAGVGRSIVEERLDLTPANMRVFKIFFALGTCMHLYACAYWRIKLETVARDDIDLFLSSKNAEESVSPGVLIASKTAIRLRCWLLCGCI